MNSEAVKFLEKLRPGGPWLLTAIHPESRAITTTEARDTKAVNAFVAKHNGKRNLYFSVNPTKLGLTEKAKKADITRIEYMHVDLDPREGEKPAEAKKRYLAALKEHAPEPTAILDSGNGIRALWKLKESLQPDHMAAVEARSKAALLTLGGTTGTQNIDRILRLPGTTNLPNAKKIKAGRVKCPATLIRFNGATCGLSDFPSAGRELATTSTTSSAKLDWDKADAYGDWLEAAADLPEGASDKARAIVAWDGDDLDDLNDKIGTQYGSTSELVLGLAALLKRCMPIEKAAAALLCDLPCNQHITRQKDQRRAVERAILNSYEPWRKSKNGNITPTMHNARLAIGKLGVKCSHDTFHGKLLFGYQGDAVHHALQGEDVSDHGIIALRQQISDEFGFDPGDKATRDAVVGLANENCFDPVRDMLDKAQREWDGEARLDAMVATHLNCADTEVNRAFWRTWMIAAVRRVRHPGCKFDLIPVLESPEGWNKSKALRLLAIDDENFSDANILTLSEKEVQEQLGPVWIHEIADMAGMKKAEVEKVKAFASRQVDSARPAFGHFLVRQARHSVEVGTTNAHTYLQSQTGNRRFGPMRVLRPIDPKLIEDDRWQLWGEAAKREANGESITIPKELWGAAATVQEERRVVDPWEDLVDTMPRYNERKSPEGVVHVDYDGEREIATAADILATVFGKLRGQQTRQDTMRLAEIMKRRGWERGKIWINGKQHRGYIRWRKTERGRLLKGLLGEQPT